MDKKSMEIMRRIHASIPKELKDNIVKVERNTSIAEQVEQARNGRHLKKWEEEKLEQYTQAGALVRETKTQNKEVTQKIAAYLDGKIKAEMAAGRLKKPGKDDPWVRKMRKNYGPQTSP